MSLSQYKSDYENLHVLEETENFNGRYKDNVSKSVLLAGIEDNQLRRIHPVFNVRYDKLAKAKDYYYEKRMLTSPSKRKESREWQR